ncbi:MAG: AAA family ATPase [Chlamydiales bacterium]|nr:AAA family ATPase [Chlamydiales bacterium]
MSYLNAFVQSINPSNICWVLGGVSQAVSAIPQVTGAITSLTFMWYVASPYTGKILARVTKGSLGTSDDVLKRVAYRALASELSPDERAKLDAAEKHAKKLAKESSLPKFCIDLTSDVVARAKARELPSYTRRENIEMALLTVLAKSDSASALIEGESGAGKTSLVDYLALQAALNPDHELHGYRFVRLCVRDFKTDKKGFQKQINAFMHGGEAACFADIINKINQQGNLILVLDELQLLVGGHHNFFTDFKTILSEGRVRIIGTTTDGRLLNQLFNSDSDQIRRFERIYVPTLDQEGASKLVYDQLVRLKLPVIPHARLIGDGSNTSELAEVVQYTKRLADAICYFSDSLPGVFPAKASSFLQRLHTYYATKRKEAQGRGIDNLPLILEHVVELYEIILSTSGNNLKITKKASKAEMLANFQMNFVDYARIDQDFKLICKQKEIEFEAGPSPTLSGLFDAELDSIALSLDKSGTYLSPKQFFSISNFNQIFYSDLLESLKPLSKEGATGCLSINLENLSKFLQAGRSEEEVVVVLSKLSEKLKEFKSRDGSLIIFRGSEVLQGINTEPEVTESTSQLSSRPTSISSLCSNDLLHQAGMMVQTIAEPLSSMGLVAPELPDNFSLGTQMGSKAPENKRCKEESSQDEKYQKYLQVVYLLVKSLNGSNVILCSSGNKALVIDEVKTSYIDTSLSYHSIYELLKKAAQRHGLRESIANDIVFYGLYHGGENFNADQAYTVFRRALVTFDEIGENVPVQQLVADELSSTKTFIEATSQDITVMEESVASSDPLLESASYQSLVCQLKRSMNDSRATYFELKEPCAVRAAKFFAALKNDLLQEDTLVFDLNLRSVMSKRFTSPTKVKLLKQGLEFMLKKAQSQSLPAVIIIDPASSDADIDNFLKLFKLFGESYAEGESPEIQVVFRKKPRYKPVKTANGPASGEEGLSALQQLALKSVQKTAIGAAASTFASTVLSGEKVKGEETEDAVGAEDESEFFNLSQIERGEMQALIEEGMNKQKMKWPSLLNLYVQLYNEKKCTIEDILKLEKVVCKKKLI